MWAAVDAINDTQIINMCSEDVEISELKVYVISGEKEDSQFDI